MNESSRKTRPKSQVMSNNSSTSPIPSHSRKNGSSDSLPSHRYENEWEMRKKELTELKSRCSQMEKTMRWWSDCTDNWRKKWSEVKTERNHAREELKATKLQLAQVMKQLDGFQPRDGNSKLAQSDVRIYSNVEPPPQLLPRSSSVTAPAKKSYSQTPPPLPPQNKCNLSDNGFLYKPNFAFPQNSKHKYESEHQLQGACGGQRPYQTQASKSKVTRRVQTDLSGSGISVLDRELVSLLEEKVSHLKFKLDEVTARLSMERQEKSLLIQRVERLQRELGDLNDLYESLKKELCEINGKEFTESEIESYADDKEDIEDLGLELESDTEENRLIEQLAHDNEELDETDKHTPTAEVDIHKSVLLAVEQIANGDGDGSSDTSSIRDTNNTDPSLGTSPLCDRKSTPEQEVVEIQVENPNSISKQDKPVSEILIVDEEIERKVQQLKGQLKAINFQGESHEKLDLRCFADLTEHNSSVTTAVETKPVEKSEIDLISKSELDAAGPLNIVGVEPPTNENEPDAVATDEGNNRTVTSNNITAAEELTVNDSVQVWVTAHGGKGQTAESSLDLDKPELHITSTNGVMEKVDGDSTPDTCSAEIRTTDV